MLTTNEEVDIVNFVEKDGKHWPSNVLGSTLDQSNRNHSRTSNTMGRMVSHPTHPNVTLRVAQELEMGRGKRLVTGECAISLSQPYGDGWEAQLSTISNIECR